MRTCHSLALCLLALCAAQTGCVVVAQGSPTPAVGALSVDWTLAGEAHPDTYAYYAIDRVDVAVYDASDRAVVWAQPYCEDFGVTFDGLEDAGYSVEVTLLDVTGAAVSDTLVLSVDVWDGEETVVDVDFPPSTID